MPMRRTRTTQRRIVSDFFARFDVRLIVNDDLFLSVDGDNLCCAVRCAAVIN